MAEDVLSSNPYKAVVFLTDGQKKEMTFAFGLRASDGSETSARERALEFAYRLVDEGASFRHYECDRISVVPPHRIKQVDVEPVL